jgi:hypothetical protein
MQRWNLVLWIYAKENLYLQLFVPILELYVNTNLIKITINLESYFATFHGLETTITNNSVAIVRERTTSTYRRLSVKLVPTFADRGCRIASATDPYCRILDFLD